ncbi:PadR family transcriptional regulator [Acidobacteria bacterium AB60]|nr:PadR family transcriptional regulator [Acidobacteria bacterium AB60]
MDGRQAQVLKGLAELALLSLLEEGPQYGLEILDRLREDAGLGLAEGTIYPLLHRLEGAKLVQSKWRLDAEASRPRKYYELTSSGRKELAVQLTEWFELSNALGKFLDRRRLK